MVELDIDCQRKCERNGTEQGKHPLEEDDKHINCRNMERNYVQSLMGK